MAAIRYSIRWPSRNLREAVLSPAGSPALRCAIYARISKERCKVCGKAREACSCAEFSGQDVENQIGQLRKFAQSQNWEVHDEYVDHVSGSGKVYREQFSQMMEAAARRRFDVVLFWALDRFSREGVRETLVHLTRLDNYGVGWRSFTEQYLDSCGIFKDAVLAILAVVAKQERIRISERTKAGLEIARKKGSILGRPRVHVDIAKARKLQNTCEMCHGYESAHPSEECRSFRGLGIRQIAARMGLKKSRVAMALREQETTA